MRYIKTLLILATVITAFFAVATRPATAAGNNCNNSIVGGLYSGVNAALGTSYSCKQSSPGNQSNNAVRSQTPSHLPATQQTTGYVALGDSVAAGLGLRAANNGDPACGVSTQAYGAIVAKQRFNGQYQNLSCSGATAGDLVSEQHLSGTGRDIEPQLDKAFASGKPSVMSVTAGANDLYWQAYIRKCYASTCGTATDNATASALLTALRAKLTYSLESINNRSNGQPPKVVFTGYYQPLSLACSQQQTNVTADEIRWINGELRQVNAVIKSAVNQYDFARYAPVNFSGHELCSADPWVQGITSSAPIHPTARGQLAIARSVLAQIRQAEATK